MTLQASGQLTFLNLYSEYGGFPPVMSNYYRGGAYVVNSVYTPPVGGSLITEGPFFTNFGNGYGVVLYNGGGTDPYDIWQLNVYWNSVLVAVHTSATWGLGTANVPLTSTVGIYTYYHGTTILYNNPDVSLSSDVYRTYTSGGTAGYYTYYNQNVPTSGQISLSNFYGMGNP
jgi:hypothetical protein